MEIYGEEQINISSCNMSFERTLEPEDSFNSKQFEYAK